MSNRRDRGYYLLSAFCSSPSCLRFQSWLGKCGANQWRRFPSVIYCSPGIVATSIKERKRERGSTLVFPSRPPTAHPYYVTQPKEDVSSVQVQCSMPRGKATWADSEKFSSRNDFEFSVQLSQRCFLKDFDLSN